MKEQQPAVITIQPSDFSSLLDKIGDGASVLTDLYHQDQRGDKTMRVLQAEAAIRDVPMDADGLVRFERDLVTEAMAVQHAARALKRENDPRAEAARQAAICVSQIIRATGSVNPGVKAMHDRTVAATAKALRGLSAVQRDRDSESALLAHVAAVTPSVLPDFVAFLDRKATVRPRKLIESFFGVAATAGTVAMGLGMGATSASAADKVPSFEPAAKVYAQPEVVLEPANSNKPENIVPLLDTPKSTQVDAAVTSVTPIGSEQPAPKVELTPAEKIPAAPLTPPKSAVSAQPTSIETIIPQEKPVKAMQTGVRMSTDDLGLLPDLEPSQGNVGDTIVGSNKVVKADTVNDAHGTQDNTTESAAQALTPGDDIMTFLPPRSNILPPETADPGANTDNSGMEVKPGKKIRVKPPEVAVPSETPPPAAPVPKPAAPAPEAPKAPAAPAPEAPKAPAPEPEKPAPVPDVIINPALAGETMWTPGNLEFIRDHLDMYKNVEKQTGVAWEIMAALHYREASLGMSNPGNGQGLFQLYSSGIYFAPGPVSQEEFTRQAVLAANFMKEKAQYGAVKGELSLSNPDKVKDTLFSYNGRAQAYANQAAALGFKLPAEGSPYVMNRADDKRNSAINPNWGQILTDGGPLGMANQQPGAWPLIEGLQKIEKIAHDTASSEAKNQADAADKARKDKADADKKAKDAKDAAERASNQGPPKFNGEWLPVVPNGTPITAPFGFRGYSNGVEVGHSGVDFGAPVGTPFTATVGGKVELVTSGDVTKQQFCIDALNALGQPMSVVKDPFQKEVHVTTVIGGDTYVTVYAHLSAFNPALVSGGYIQAGQEVGKTGDSGCSTGAHAHFEVRKNGVPIDPNLLNDDPKWKLLAQGTPAEKPAPKSETVDNKTERIGQRVVDFSKKFDGYGYLWGGGYDSGDPKTGQNSRPIADIVAIVNAGTNKGEHIVDCGGLLRASFLGALGVDITALQFNAGEQTVITPVFTAKDGKQYHFVTVTDKSKAQAGDVFTRPGHVGFITGTNAQANTYDTFEAIDPNVAIEDNIRPNTQRWDDPTQIAMIYRLALVGVTSAGSIEETLPTASADTTEKDVSVTDTADSKKVNDTIAEKRSTQLSEEGLLQVNHDASSQEDSNDLVAKKLLAEKKAIAAKTAAEAKKAALEKANSDATDSQKMTQETLVDANS